MSIIRYNPLNSFSPTTFGNLVENFVNDRISDEPVFMPAVDILKEDDHLALFVHAPGMKKENFTIDLNDHHLIISGEKKMDEDLKKKFNRIESRFGTFKRSFKLNDDINQEEITAEYQDGILKVTLPLREKKETKKAIEIK